LRLEIFRHPKKYKVTLFKPAGGVADAGGLERKETERKNCWGSPVVLVGFPARGLMLGSDLVGFPGGGMTFSVGHPFDVITSKPAPLGSCDVYAVTNPHPHPQRYNPNTFFFLGFYLFLRKKF